MTQELYAMYMTVYVYPTHICELIEGFLSLSLSHSDTYLGSKRFDKTHLAIIVPQHFLQNK